MQINNYTVVGQHSFRLYILLIYTFVIASMTNRYEFLVIVYFDRSICNKNCIF